MIPRFCLFLAILAINVKADGVFYSQPEQIHIAYGGDPTKMWVTWVTLNSTQDAWVSFGISKFDQNVSGTEDLFIDGGSLQRHIYMHRVLLTNLKAGETFVYRVGGQYGWSSIYSFKTVSPYQKSFRFAIFGDFGTENPEALSELTKETQSGNFDMMLHNGDFAYDMHDNNATNGDQFMRQIQPIAANVPYMTTVGNHEEKYNFSNYFNRFTMPDNSGYAPLFYSFDIGPCHFVMFSSEFYFTTKSGLAPNEASIKAQFEWIENDLKQANSNRQNVPWIFTMAHRPMYCSNVFDFDCTHYQAVMRVGQKGNHSYALEPLLYKYGVDMHFGGHEHSYERLWPTYNWQNYNGSDSAPYTNPGATVHIVSGAAGAKEPTVPFVFQPNDWSAFRNSEYGYSRMTVYNATHLHYEQVSTDRHGLVFDDWWLIQNKHGSFQQK